MSVSKLLTADETAHALGIARRTLGDWALRGYFPKPTYLGRRAYYSPDQINSFIERQIADSEEADDDHSSPNP